MQFHLGMLNLCSPGGASREALVARLSDTSLDLLLLQEVNVGALPWLSSELGMDWFRCSLGADIHDARLGVAILGQASVEPRATHQLEAQDFNQAVYPELARWFHERHLALDLSITDKVLRVGVFHATPGTSKGPGGLGLGVGYRKPWFHARLAEWVAEWPAPFLFGIDANTPRVDALHLSETQFHMPSSALGEPPHGEDLLLGQPGVALHEAHDLWRTWLASPEGVHDLAAIPPGGPLARSYTTDKDSSHANRTWYRYDQVWASAGIQPTNMAYDYDPIVSDHALVTATIEL